MKKLFCLEKSYQVLSPKSEQLICPVTAQTYYSLSYPTYILGKCQALIVIREHMYNIQIYNNTSEEYT